MEDVELKKAFRNGYLLLAAAFVFVVLFFLFVLKFSLHAPKPGWEMGGTKFVPASSDYGNRYWVPPVKAEKGKAP